MKSMLDATSVVFTRQMRLLLRNPVWVFFGLTQPILYLVLFGPLLTNVRAGGLGGSASWSLFVPGLLLQLAIFGAGFAGFGIIQEVREGVLDRQRVTPAPRVSLLLGRTLSNVVTIGVQALILVLVAIPFGLQPSWFGVIVTLLLVCVLAMGISAASYSMGIILKDEDAFAPFISRVFPCHCCCSPACSCRCRWRPPGCTTCPGRTRWCIWSTRPGHCSSAATRRPTSSPASSSPWR